MDNTSFSNDLFRKMVQAFKPQSLNEDENLQEAVPFKKHNLEPKLKETDLKIQEMDSELGISEEVLDEVDPSTLEKGKEYVYMGYIPSTGKDGKIKLKYQGVAKDSKGMTYHLFSDDRGTSGVFGDSDVKTRFQSPEENMRSDFDSFRNSLNEMASAYKIKNDVDTSKAKKVLALAAEKVKSKSLKDALNMLSTKGEVDFKVWAKSQGKDVATWNNPSNRKVLDVELKDYIEPIKAAKEKPTPKSTPAKEKPVSKEKTVKSKVEKPKSSTTKSPKSTSISSDEKTEKAEEIIKKHASKVKQGTAKKADLKLTWNQWVKKQGFDQETLEYFQEKWNEKVK